MEEEKLKPAKLIIWDLDNCIYPYDDAFWNMIHEASARAALKLLEQNGADNKTDFLELKQLAEQSQQLYGKANKLVVERFDLDKEEMFQAFLKELNYDFMKPNHALNALFKSTKTKHVILTHNSTSCARVILQNLGLGQFFPEGSIVSIQDEGILPKDVGKQAFKIVLSRYGFKAEDSLMVEDTAENLKYPKTMGMQTVFISYGKGDGDGHADHVFHSAQDFLRAYQKVVPPPARNRR
jgi:FMN phosphatase YigB (HAD superfamily)